MVLADTAEDLGREKDILQSLGRGFDGVILCSPRLPAAVINRAVGALPLVIINGESRSAPSVLMDVEQGIGQAIEHLYALGHRRVAYVPGPAAAWANQRRLQCISALTTEWGVDLVTVGNQTANVNGGLAASAAVLSSGASAVIAYNDLVALGVESGARALGRRCPDDLSIIGIDDLDVAAASDPGLTSVQVAIARSGALALELLLDKIAGRSVPDDPIHLPSQLIVRGSTAVASLRASRPAAAG
jgi:LacI family transcriptional regulator